MTIKNPTFSVVFNKVLIKKKEAQLRIEDFLLLFVSILFHANTDRHLERKICHMHMRVNIRIMIMKQLDGLPGLKTL